MTFSPVKQGCVGILWRPRGDIGPIHGGTCHCTLARLRDQIVFGIEMPVEAAMGQLRRLHDVGDADAVKPLLARQRACRIDDAFAVFCGFLSAHAH
jgi:hypothetical protein